MEYECSSDMEIGDELLTINGKSVVKSDDINEIIYYSKRPLYFQFKKKEEIKILNWKEHPCFYYEITINQCDNHIIFGFLPDPDLFTINLDEGNLQQKGLITLSPQEISDGMTIGCGIIPKTQQILYIINDKIYFKTYSNLYSTNYYPAIIFPTEYTKVSTNFGCEEFVYKDCLDGCYIVNEHKTTDLYPSLRLINSLCNRLLQTIQVFNNHLSFSLKGERKEIEKVCEKINNCIRIKEKNYFKHLCNTESKDYRAVKKSLFKLLSIKEEIRKKTHDVFFIYIFRMKMMIV